MGIHSCSAFVEEMDSCLLLTEGVVSKDVGSPAPHNKGLDQGSVHQHPNIHSLTLENLHRHRLAFRIENHLQHPGPIFSLSRYVEAHSEGSTGNSRRRSPNR